MQEIFAVPVLDNILIHAPLHGLTTLVNRAAARQIRAALAAPESAVHPALVPVVDRLRGNSAPCPAPRSGPLAQPLFLGLIPTRSCNMACRYCDFAAPKTRADTMTPAVARSAINGYFDLLLQHDQRHAEVHFFGGEPFFAESLVHFAVNYARQQAQQRGLTVRFEATTNGLYNTARARWIAETFDTIVLSLDGPADLQDRNRPGLNGRSVFDAVVRSARIFSDGSVELVLRTCVTHDSVERLPAMAAWIAQEFLPSTWVVEALTPSSLNAAVGLDVPDPWAFARCAQQAARLLAPHGIALVNSTTDTRRRQRTFCPVGQDALIVSPDGTVDACYLLEQDWARGPLNMRCGRLEGDQLRIDTDALAAIRNFTVDVRPLCADCLCRNHCAGGCPVNHDTARPPGAFDAPCVFTRLLTIAELLRDQPALVDAWFADRAALEASVWRTSDRLADGEDLR